MTKTTQRVSVAIGRELHPVGELLFESDGRRQTSAFRYRVEWLDHPGAFPIAPTMPLVDYQWRGHCRAAGLTAGGIRQYEGAFEHEETRTAKHLCGVP